MLEFANVLYAYQIFLAGIKRIAVRVYSLGFLVYGFLS